MLNRLTTLLHGLIRKANGNADYGFRPVAEFVPILKTERQRADRGNTPLTVVEFQPASAEAHDATFRLLREILPKRLRTTDQTGWIDANRIAVALPGTPTAGGWKLGEDVCREFPQDVPAPICTILSYPSQGAPQELRRDTGGSRPEEWSVRPMETLFLMKMPVWKRAIDVVGAGLGLLLLSPLFLVVAVLIKLSSRGPVFYSQPRSGEGGKPFRMYKFRSMVVDADAQKARLMALNEQDGPAFKIRNDPRVTKIGSFLRKTSIDELPQLWNVFRGDMTLVGPRAMYCPETDRCSPWQRQRLDVRQGITCIWQVRGRSAVTFDEWMRMDLRYIRKRSLWKDLWLLAETIPAVLLRRGAC